MINCLYFRDVPVQHFSPHKNLDVIQSNFSKMAWGVFNPHCCPAEKGVTLRSWFFILIALFWPQYQKMSYATLCGCFFKYVYLLSDDGRDFGGSILMAGSHSPGGRTITSSRNSSIPANRSCLSLALYAMSWNTYMPYNNRNDWSENMSLLYCYVTS